MLDTLTAALAQKEKERITFLKELAFPAFKHSLLTEKNNLIEHGGVKNKDWYNEMRILKHPPNSVQDVGLEALLNRNDFSFESLAFLGAISRLYNEVMGDLYNLKLAEPGTKTTWTSEERAQYEENIKTQKKLEQEMAQLIKDKLEPLQASIDKTKAEAEHFQELHTKQAQESFEKAKQEQD